MPGPNEVLIRVGASALNFLDLLMIEGKYQVKPPLPFVPGRDLAGEIVAVGAEVSSLRIGQRVAAQPAFGAFADMPSPETTCASRFRMRSTMWRAPPAASCLLPSSARSSSGGSFSRASGS